MEESSSELTLAEVEELDRLADAFERAFADGTPPSIDVFLGQTVLPRKVVLRELVRIDFEMRGKVGPPAELEDYLRNYPDESSVVLAALQQYTQGQDTTATGNYSEVLTPEQIGRYAVRRRLGSGGFGIVYLAHDPQLDRLVAIKVPKVQSLGSAQLVESFLREASAAAKLSHPALVSVYDVQIESGQPFIVYEYVRGENLASWAARQQLSFQQIARLFVSVADALRHAHGQGVVHCDLKLANILIDSDSNPRITDFGLALREHAIDREYQVSGTPITMAPEQICGELHHVDARTDIWAIGVMLYELLLGRRPFHGTSRSELYYRIQHAAPVQPTQVDPNLPPGLERICMKCIAKRRSERFQTADELRVDLEAWLNDAQPGHVPHASLLAVLSLILGCLGISMWSTAKARSSYVRQVVNQVATAEIEDIPKVLEESGVSWRRLRPVLEQSAQLQPLDSVGRLKIELALLTHDPERLDRLFPRFLELSPKDLDALCTFVSLDNPARIEGLWQVVGRESPLVSRPTNARKLLAASGLLSKFGNAVDPRWQTVAQPIVNGILSMGIENNRDWARLHRQVRSHLWPFFDEVRLDARRVPYSPETERKYDTFQTALATDVLVDFAGDDTSQLGDLLFTGATEHFVRVFPSFANRTIEALDIVQRELACEPARDWNDVDWSAVGPVPDSLVSQINAAQGLFADNFAYCQALPFIEFQPLAEALREFGYRPLRVRPYTNEPNQLLTAAVWTRDRCDWKFEPALSKLEVNEMDANSRTDGLIPVDMAGYVEGIGAEPAKFCALFAASDDSLTDFKMYAGIAEDAQWQTEFQLANGLMRIASSLHCYLNAQGEREYCGILARSHESSTTFKAQSTSDFERYEDWNRIPTDVSVVPVRDLDDPGRFYTRIVHEWEGEDFRQDWLNSSHKDLLLADAYYHLGDYDQAAKVCTQVIKRVPHFASAYRWRSRLLAMRATDEDEQAQLETKHGILEDLARFRRLTWSAAEAIAAEATAMAYFGAHPEYLTQVEALVGDHPLDPQLLYEAALGYAGCATALNSLGGQDHKAQVDELAARAVEILSQAIDTGFQDWIRIRRDSDWSLFAERLDFGELLDNSAPQVLYAGARCTSRTMDAKELHGLSIDDHRLACQNLADDGYRPVAMSVATVGTETSCASVWHRPVTVQYGLHAFRQANAAVAAYHLGSLELVWPLLTATPVPDLRTNLIHAFGPAKCDPQALLDRLFEEANPTQRVGLIQALGQFELTEAQRHNATPWLLKCFRDDIDAGVHSSCEWLLKKWGLTKEIAEIHQDLATGRREGKRNWYRCKSNEFTFAIIDGPVEFLRGMARYSQSPEKIGIEPLNRARINRSFAIATTEVTVRQMESLFPSTRVNKPLDSQFYISQDSAASGIPWKLAVLYCQFRDHKEKTPGSQWCFSYIDNGSAPTCVARDYLSRTGYRLPTVSEWEYAARAGATSSRHFGESHRHLDQYAWFGVNSELKIHPVGVLQPNDFGLFDTLGNASEWLMQYDYSTYATGPIGDDIECMEPIEPSMEKMLVKSEGKDSTGGDFSNILTVNIKRKMSYRGYDYSSPTIYLYTSKHAAGLPDTLSRRLGFRLARTMPAEEE